MCGTMPRMGSKPDISAVLTALRVVGAALGVDRADYCFEGRFRLRLTDDWSLVLSPEDAGRIRVSACYAGRIRVTMWSRSDDYARLVALARSAQSEAAALAL